MVFGTIRRATGGTVTAIVLAASPGWAQASGSYTVSGDRVQIYNIAGAVDIVGGGGSAVRVTIDAGGPDADELTVETGRLGRSETLRVIYPDDRIIYDQRGRRSRTQMRVRDDGTFFGPGSRGRRVTIAGSGRGLDAYADMRIEVPEGQVIGVYVGVGEVTVANVNGDLLVDVASAPVESSSTSGRLVIDTGSGSVDVRDATGEVSIDTGSGSVEIESVQGDIVTIDTGSGSVRGGDINAPELNVDTGSGGINLRDVTTTDAVLDTGSGSVRLELLTDVNDLSIDTGSGAVTVVFPEGLGARLDLETSSGGIDFDVPVTMSRFSRHSLQGSIGDGRGLIHVDTGSGSIRFIQR